LVNILSAALPIASIGSAILPPVNQLNKLIT
jgi:hypothetical protein